MPQKSSIWISFGNRWGIWEKRFNICPPSLKFRNFLEVGLQGEDFKIKKINTFFHFSLNPMFLRVGRTKLSEIKNCLSSSKREIGNIIYCL